MSVTIEEQENHVDLVALKFELKSWEARFQETNGRKAERADVKKDANISAKYRLYDRAAKRIQPKKPNLPAATPKKTTRHVEFREVLVEKAGNAVAATPKRSPSKKKLLGGQLVVPSPVREVEATPLFIRRGLGPTPQKDGQILGIFDALPGETPCKSETQEVKEVQQTVAATPSKQTSTTSDMKFSKTPQSSGKRFFLAAFEGTPLKRKREENDIGTSSSSKRKFETPAFLRRSFPLAKIDEEGNEPAAAVPSFRRRPFGKVRSLSNMIQGLRKQEDDRMDEEWDVLREMEEEQEGGGEKTKKAPKVLVEDSQPAEMPLGPDQAPESSEESAVEGDGTVRKPWKKKGLKRQTRRVNMKPVLHKAKKAENAAEDSDDEVDIVAETQPQDPDAAYEGAPNDPDSDFDEGNIKTKKPRPKDKKPTAKNDKDKEKEKEKKPRKIDPNATSHANFQKLKIKNKNSKANGRGGGRRFGRR